MKNVSKKFGIWKYIDILVVSAEEGITKTDKRIFETALTHAGCKPEEVAMVGNRLDNDIIPVNDLGMYTIWIKQGNWVYASSREKFEYPDWSISSLKEMEIFMKVRNVLK